MQVLVEVSDSFREYVVDRFSKDPWSCTANIAAVFLASAVIKFSDDLAKVYFVRKLIKEDLRKVLGSKYMKRILMTYCERAPLAILNELYIELGF